MTIRKLISVSINDALETLNALKKRTKVPKSVIIRQLTYYMYDHPTMLDDILKENYDERKQLVRKL